jgi:cytochrome c553
VEDTSPDNKLYPFKYKTAEQPIRNSTKELIALDTNVYFRSTNAQNRAADATKAGLINMGYPATDPFSWVKTDTFQLLNHQVSPPSQALACAACHGSTTRMNLKGDLGYALKGTEAAVCSQCHEREGNPGFTSVHSRHVAGYRYDCSRCHSFTRPERGLR